jgi:hypothetical protein
VINGQQFIPLPDVSAKEPPCTLGKSLLNSLKCLLQAKRFFDAGLHANSVAIGAVERLNEQELRIEGEQR